MRAMRARRLEGVSEAGGDAQGEVRGAARPARMHGLVPPVRRRAGSPAASGFALVEALMATVIVGIGLLGLMQLILVSLRDGAEALTRTQAVTLVGDIAERIRANPGALDAYDLANYDDDPAEHGCATKGTATRTCSAIELAEDDLARWQAQAFEMLPRADDATVSYSSMSDGQLARYLIEVSWLVRGTDSPVTLRAELQLAGGAQT